MMMMLMMMLIAADDDDGDDDGDDDNDDRIQIRPGVSHHREAFCYTRRKSCSTPPTLERRESSSHYDRRVKKIVPTFAFKLFHPRIKKYFVKKKRLVIVEL